MSKISHRKRVMAALSHEQPDTVPIDFASTRDSSIVVEGYGRLKQHFGIAADNHLVSRMMRVVDVDERILEALDIDTRGVFPGAPKDIEVGKGRYRDEWGVERIRPAGSLYYDQVEFPLAGDIRASDITRYPWPDPHAAIRTAGLREQVRAMRERGDHALVLNLPSGFIHTSQYLRGFQDWFMDFVRDRELLDMLFDAVLEVSLEMCRAMLTEVGGEVDVLMASDDLGLQDGLMVSPEVYRELIKPRHKKYFDLMHEMSSAKLFFHTCGAVIDIIDDFVEIGVDVLNPVQVSAAGMDPAVLKEKWGDKLAFWGAIDTHHVLPHGAVEDVEKEVELRIEQMGRGGGYVLSAVHNIQPDVPVENVVAMYKRARTYRPSWQ